MKYKPTLRPNLIRFMLIGIAPCTANIAVAQESPQAKSSRPGIEEVIVSARRRDESVQEVPISVSAMTSESLQNLSISSPVELGTHIPSLNFSGAGGGRCHAAQLTRATNQ